jgi:hypothetical protein
VARGQANLWRRSTPLGSSSSHSSTGLERDAEALDVADPLHRRGLRSNVPGSSFDCGLCRVGPNSADSINVKALGLEV